MIIHGYDIDAYFTAIIHRGRSRGPRDQFLFSKNLLCNLQLEVIFNDNIHEHCITLSTKQPSLIIVLL